MVTNPYEVVAGGGNNAIVSERAANAVARWRADDETEVGHPSTLRPSCVDEMDALLRAALGSGVGDQASVRGPARPDAAPEASLPAPNRICDVDRAASLEREPPSAWRP
jgi:hypothetical protein